MHGRARLAPKNIQVNRRAPPALSNSLGDSAFTGDDADPGTFRIHDLPDLNVDVTDAVAGDYTTITGLIL